MLVTLSKWRYMPILKRSFATCNDINVLIQMNIIICSIENIYNQKFPLEMTIFFINILKKKKIAADDICRDFVANQILSIHLAEPISGNQSSREFAKWCETISLV